VYVLLLNTVLEVVEKITFCNTG